MPHGAGELGVAYGAVIRRGAPGIVNPEQDAADEAELRKTLAAMPSYVSLRLVVLFVLDKGETEFFLDEFPQELFTTVFIPNAVNNPDRPPAERILKDVSDWAVENARGEEEDPTLDVVVYNVQNLLDSPPANDDHAIEGAASLMDESWPLVSGVIPDPTFSTALSIVQGIGGATVLGGTGFLGAELYLWDYRVKTDRLFFQLNRVAEFCIEWFPEPVE